MLFSVTRVIREQVLFSVTRAIREQVLFSVTVRGEHMTAGVALEMLQSADVSAVCLTSGHVTRGELRLCSRTARRVPALWGTGLDTFMLEPFLGTGYVCEKRD